MGSNSKVQIIMAGKSEQQELEATGHDHILTQEAESDESELEFSSLSLVLPPARGIVSPTVRM